MRKWSFKLLLYATCLLTTIACNEEAILNIEDASSTPFENEISNYISLMNHAKGTRSKDDTFELLPIVRNQDTVMYVVQYHNGWDLISADPHYPMTIMKSPDGVYSYESLVPSIQDHIEDIVNEISFIKNDPTNFEIDESWNWLFPNFQTNSSTRANDEDPDYNNGKWDLLDVIEHETKIEQHPHLVTTKWGQQSPWNVLMPYKNQQNNGRCAVGCTAVAFAQFVYYLHYKNGIPASTVTSAVYDPINNKYNYSGSSSTVWNSMALNKYDYSTDKTACFLSYVANCMDSEEDEKTGGTSADIRDAISKFLNKETGENYYLEKYDNKSDNKIINIIRSGCPVIARGIDVNSGGHVFLIDSYRTETSEVEYVFGWNGKTESGKDPNAYNPDGSIMIYGIQKHTSNKKTEYYYSMNWGYDGMYDNILCNLGVWSPDHNSFYSKSRYIVVK